MQYPGREMVNANLILFEGPGVVVMLMMQITSMEGRGEYTNDLDGGNTDV